MKTIYRTIKIFPLTIKSLYSFSGCQLFHYDVAVSVCVSMCQRKRLLSFLNFIESLEPGSLKSSSNLEKFYHFFKYFYLPEYLYLLILVLQLFISYMTCFCPVNHWGSVHFFQCIFALQFQQILLYCFYFLIF